MSGSSRGRVTVTFGRSGEVVKRVGPVPDPSFDDTFAAAGSKRSIRDRLGSDMDSSLLHSSQKRQRGSLGMSSLSSYSSGEMHIGKDDLRFKLLQKDAFNKAPRRNANPVDLREKLSKTSRHPVSNLDSWHSQFQSHNSSILGRIPSARGADDLLQMDSFRSSSSTWTLDNLRRRSPGRKSPTTRSSHRVQENLRGFSPQRNMEDIQRSGTFDNVRLDSYGTKRILDTSGLMSISPYTANSSLLSGSTKTVAPVVRQLPPPVSIMAKSSYPMQVDELQTIDEFLHSLGLGKYVIIFKAEEVDLTALKQMGENDLKEIGVPMGPRKKILLALAPRSKR